MIFPLLTLTGLCLVSASPKPDEAETIERDVVVIGGGASGTYTAIRLQQEKKTVALIEKECILGGHTDTYVDAETGKSFDFGVGIFDGQSNVVREFIASLNIPIVSAGSGTGSAGGPNVDQVAVNFASGIKLPEVPQNQTDVATAFGAYLAEIAKYPFLDTGFNLPSPVPDDLLLTWGEFVDKYELGPIAFILSQYIQGVGNILEQTALYVIKYASAATVTNILKQGFITTARQNNQEIYDAALAKLGDDAFVDSQVTSITRTDAEVLVSVSTPEKTQLRIKAKKLVISIPPKLEILKPFLDVNEEESALFCKFNNSYYWDAVLKNTGVPDSVYLSNVDENALYAIPASPGLYGLNPAGIPGLKTAYYSSPFYLSDDEVKADILATIDRLVKGLGYPTPYGEPTFERFNAHNPFELTVSTEAIKNGFYSKFESLQGQSNTWWTGANWQGAPDSSLIWKYTEHRVLPGLLASV